MARSAKLKLAQSVEVQEALRSISTAFIEAEFAVERLEEHEVEAIADELRRLANEGSHTALNLALASIADAHLAVIAARRSPDGVWYAVVDMIEWEDNRRSGQGVADYHTRCDGRDAAVEALRDLVESHLPDITDKVTIEARVLTELEWRADYAEREAIDHR